ncbi:hypothetical protein Tcan_00839, partial [Toxocara canis]
MFQSPQYSSLHFIRISHDTSKHIGGRQPNVLFVLSITFCANALSTLRRMKRIITANEYYSLYRSYIYELVPSHVAVVRCDMKNVFSEKKIERWLVEISVQ